MASHAVQRVAVALVFATVASVSSIAQASPLLMLTGDMTSDGSLQPRAVAGGSAAAYFNPALLGYVPAGATLGFLVLNERIGIQLDGRPGRQFAIPEGLQNAAHADLERFDNYAIATNLLQYGRPESTRQQAFVARPRQAAGSGHGTRTYEAVGLVVKMFEEHLSIGFHALIPNGEFTTMRAFFNDEREQYFSNSLHPELYTDRMTALSMALGLGIRLNERISLGVGATFALKADVVAQTYVVDTGDLGSILIDMNAPVNVGIAPHFGISFEVTDRLQLTATAHSPQRVELGTGFTFLLANTVEQASEITLVLDYTPWQFSVGAAYDLVDEPEHRLAVAASLQYAMWSSYVDRHGEKPTQSFAWGDTIAPTVGLRYGLGPFSSAFDLTYVPTPVPLQRGRSNYVDNDRIAGSLGAEFGFELFGTALEAGAQVQVHHLVPRHQAKLRTPTRADGENIAPERVKDELPDDAQVGGEPVGAAAQGLQTNNPGWPGFASGGWVLAATLHLKIGF